MVMSVGSLVDGPLGLLACTVRDEDGDLLHPRPDTGRCEHLLVQALQGCPRLRATALSLGGKEPVYGVGTRK